MTLDQDGIASSTQNLPAGRSSPANIGWLPLAEQMPLFRAALERNETLVKVLQGARELNLPNWYLAAGAVTQTVWNSVTNQHPETGINDYDIIYFDDSDLSWEAEDVAIKRGDEIYRKLGLDCDIEIRNQARVHLWYGEKWGVPCPQFRSTEHAIDTWTATSAMVGVRLMKKGEWSIYAPVGLSDIFNLVVRPNAVISTKDAYEFKLDRWRKHWPGLTIHPWPEGKLILPQKQ